MLQRLFGGSPIPSLNPQEASKRLSTGPSAPVLIDVREAWEYARGHARGAKNIPLSQLGNRVREIPRDRTVLLICQSGNRSMSAARFLMQQGITDAINVSGGTSVWQMHGLPMEGGRR